jgi:hypothetical protein
VFVENRAGSVGSDAARVNVTNPKMGTRENANEGKTQRHRFDRLRTEKKRMLRTGTSGDNLVLGEGKPLLGRKSGLKKKFIPHPF